MNLDYLGFVSITRTNETLPETSFETVSFLVDSFMQENEPAVMKNDEFNQGYKPKLVEVVHPLNNQTVDARIKKMN